jgi:hypothetical protein
LQLQNQATNTTHTNFAASTFTSSEVLVEERVMTPKTRLTGEPIMRILCKKTDALVGYLYQWNNGDVQPAWLNDAMADVRYEPMVEAA